MAGSSSAGPASQSGYEPRSRDVGQGRQSGYEPRSRDWGQEWQSGYEPRSRDVGQEWQSGYVPWSRDVDGPFYEGARYPLHEEFLWDRHGWGKDKGKGEDKGKGKGKGKGKSSNDGGGRWGISDALHWSLLNQQGGSGGPSSSAAAWLDEGAEQAAAATSPTKDEVKDELMADSSLSFAGAGKYEIRVEPLPPLQGETSDERLEFLEFTKDFLRAEFTEAELSSIFEVLGPGTDRHPRPRRRSCSAPPP